jgi:hypothetical protein
MAPVQTDAERLAESATKRRHDRLLRHPVRRRWIALKPQQAYAWRLLAGSHGMRPGEGDWEPDERAVRRLSQASRSRCRRHLITSVQCD